MINDGFGILLSGIGWGIGYPLALLVMYSLIWFLVSTAIFILSLKTRAAVQMSIAWVLGLFTTIVHLIIHILWKVFH